GKPATYTQIMSSDKPRIDAQAQKIIYLPNIERLRLEGEAKITQSGNIFEGQLIEYDIEKQVLMASGNTTPSGSPDNNGDNPQRVKMTLQPHTAPTTQTNN
ncbi:MAG: LptA/OstA family protein, partial [Gammaproteobacteria bacterium]